MQPLPAGDHIVAVADVRRNVEETALDDVGVLAAVRSELEPSLTTHDMAQNLAVAVVVPARAHAALRFDADEDAAFGLEGDFPPETRRGVARCAIAGRDGRDPVHGRSDLMSGQRTTLSAIPPGTKLVSSRSSSTMRFR